MKTVLYITSNLRRCGPVNQLYNICINLDKNKFRPVILRLSPEPNDSMEKLFQGKDIELHSLELSRIQGILKGKKLLRSLLSEINPDIIHTQGIRPDMMVSSITDINKVLSIRNDPYIDYPMKFGGLKGKIMAKGHLKAIKKAKHPVAVSKHLADIFKTKYKIETLCIQNGVNTEVFKPVSKDVKLTLRKKFNIKQEAKVFLIVGSLIKRKNNDLLLEAFDQSDKNLQIIFLGEGPEKEKLQSRCNADTNIHFVGQVSNVNEYLKAADYYVSASLDEGLPNTALEAMATGLTVILSNIAPHRELFEGVEYPFFFENNSENIKEKISLLANSNTDSYANICLHQVRDKFSARLMSEKYQNLYMQL